MAHVILPKMTLIPAGSFQMGSDNGEDKERPVHTVWVSAFEIGVYAVTNREYAVFLDATKHPAPRWFNDPSLSKPDHPIVGPSWFDAAAYGAWLSDHTGEEYRLPTEAEREKSSRGGLDGADYPWGNGLPDDHEGGRNTELETVETYAPNGYGLYGMASGVHEWCADWYDDLYYEVTPERDPQGPDSGERRVARGGSWRHSVRFTRCAARSSLAPDKRFSDFGFRLARSL